MEFASHDHCPANIPEKMPLKPKLNIWKWTFAIGTKMFLSWWDSISDQAACISIIPGFTCRRTLLQKPAENERYERKAGSTTWSTQSDPSPEHLLKLIDLLSCICHSVHSVFRWRQGKHGKNEFVCPLIGESLNSQTQ